ncbi:MAG: hypothetical protein KC441_00975, partial [Anaerolineales bacterium]|nr:hypothetical protein [Anaerolineales bacterium]
RRPARPMKFRWMRRFEMYAIEVVMVLGDEVPALMTEFVIRQTCFLLRPLYVAGLMDKRIEDAEENPA